MLLCFWSAVVDHLLFRGSLRRLCICDVRNWAVSVFILPLFGVDFVLLLFFVLCVPLLKVWGFFHNAFNLSYVVFIGFCGMVKAPGQFGPRVFTVSVSFFKRSQVKRKAWFFCEKVNFTLKQSWFNWGNKYRFHKVWSLSRCKAMLVCKHGVVLCPRSYILSESKCYRNDVSSYYADRFVRWHDRGWGAILDSVLSLLAHRPWQQMFEKSVRHNTAYRVPKHKFHTNFCAKSWISKNRRKKLFDRWRM